MGLKENLKFESVRSGIAKCKFVVICSKEVF